MPDGKSRAQRNRTITVGAEERAKLLTHAISIREPCHVGELADRIINSDLFDVLGFLPADFVDLLVVDPPYNLSKTFNKTKFVKTSSAAYEAWLDSWFSKLLPCLKRDASIYVCCDWQSSAAVQGILEKYLIVRNRITWEREKGRGALTNWKNCSEDIWFCTVSDSYCFDVDAVKLKRKVIAPYRDESGAPKDWDETSNGNFRLTHPSNLWTDISVPFWSMPENTDHPTQKPEKLLAKLILASSTPGQFVLDPFAGSGTACVVAKKLGRRFLGIEIDEHYCCLAAKRLMQADADKSIQGYHDGYFWERNSLSDQKASSDTSFDLSLFCPARPENPTHEVIARPLTRGLFDE